MIKIMTKSEDGIMGFIIGVIWALILVILFHNIDTETSTDHYSKFHCSSEIEWEDDTVYCRDEYGTWISRQYNIERN